MIKLTVSGSFKTSPGTDQGRYDFIEVTGLLPDCTEEYHISYAQRMFPIWKMQDQNKAIKKEPFAGLIKIFIDEVEEDAGGSPDCCGKDIKTMTWEELQSLACYLNLREIPLYRKGSLRGAQEKAYETYMKNIEQRKVFRTAKDISVLKERMYRNLEALELQQDEIEERVNEAIAKGFNMLVDPSTPETSYNFKTLAPVIIPDYTFDKSESDTDGVKSPKKKVTK